MNIGNLDIAKLEEQSVRLRNGQVLEVNLNARILMPNIFNCIPTFAKHEDNSISALHVFFPAEANGNITPFVNNQIINTAPIRQLVHVANHTTHVHNYDELALAILENKKNRIMHLLGIENPMLPSLQTYNTGYPSGDSRLPYPLNTLYSNSTIYSFYTDQNGENHLVGQVNF